MRRVDSYILKIRLGHCAGIGMGMDPLHRSLAPPDPFKPGAWGILSHPGIKTRADPSGRGDPHSAGFAYQYVPMGKICKAPDGIYLGEIGSHSRRL